MTYEELAAAAIKAKQGAYAPYSNFKVGAALLTKGGKLYTGANVECAAYSPTSCAERSAFVKAVNEGERAFAGIAVAGGFSDEKSDFCYPCGVCRQVMAEFCDAYDFKIIVVKNAAEFKVYNLNELLPHSFGPKDLA